GVTGGFWGSGCARLPGVERRTRLTAEAGLRLRATPISDYPPPAALAEQLHDLLAPDAGPDGDQAAAIRRAFAEIPLSRLRSAGLLESLLQLAGLAEPSASAPQKDDEIAAIENLDTAALVALAMNHGNAS